MRGRYLAGSAVLAALLILSAGASVSAGGTQETVPEEAGTERVAPAPAGRRELQRELLASIGVRPFEQDIATVDFTLAGLQDEEIRLRDHRGEVVFLNFWATWCPPCREEMPAMEIMHRELADLPFRILAVSVQEDRGTVSGYIQEYGYTFPILLDPTGRVSSNYGVRGLPTTYFISSDGFVLGMVIGILDWKDPVILGTMRDILELEASPDER
ncbi:MAG: TlpA family protein disulfide reductase [Spirochaetaceae bacterium]|nr:MAG: TlpA family protein disulfide reductase [Spirochaetaceae bacterium]